MVMRNTELWNSGYTIKNTVNGKKMGRHEEKLAYCTVNCLIRLEDICVNCG